MENMEVPIKNKEGIANEAKNVAREIFYAHHDFIEQINNLASKNDHLKNGMIKYGGKWEELFQEFGFQCYDKSSVGFGKEYLFSPEDSSLEDYIELNKRRDISLEQIDQIKKTLDERYQKIIIDLSQDFVSDGEAYTVIEKVHRELILPVLNEQPVFSN